jgi:hypothetical protein
VDQTDSDLKARGIAALPMCIAQANAMISIVDENYYNRAWCCVEALIINVLQRAYGVHWWYEYTQPDGDGRYVLRKGDMAQWHSISEAKLTVEADRSKLLFLERQAKLLGNEFK